MISRVLSRGLKIFVLLSACAWLIVIPVGAGPIDQNVSLELLLQYERNLLQESEKRTDLNPSDSFGSDPFKIFHLRDKGQFLIMLRNRSELLLADQSLKLLDRKTTPRSPTGWTLARISHQPTAAGAHLPKSTALGSDKGLGVLSSTPAPFVSHAPCNSGHLRALASRPDENCGLAEKVFLFVAGELSGEIQLYEIRNGSLEPRGKIHLHGIGSIRDLIYVPSSQSLFLLDDFDRRLHQLVLAPNWSKQVKLDFKRKTFPLGAGPIQIRYQDDHLLINLLLEHSLWIIPLVQGSPDFSLSSRITHDGPIWDFDAVAWKDSLMIAAGGVENRPLNRLGGEFGYIDSYLFFVRSPARSYHRSISLAVRRPPQHRSLRPTKPVRTGCCNPKGRAFYFLVQGRTGSLGLGLWLSPDNAL